MSAVTMENFVCVRRICLRLLPEQFCLVLAAVMDSVAFAVVDQLNHYLPSGFSFFFSFRTDALW
jgi:hypothetical protein